MNQLSFVHPVPPPLTVQDIPRSERPQNRLDDNGPEACSSSELLAVLLGSGAGISLGQRLLADYGGLAALARAAPTELQARQGIGPVSVARIRAAFELGRRLSLENLPERACISSPADAAAILMPRMSLLEQEYMYVLLVDTRNRVIGNPVEVYHGNVNTSVIRVGELFREAIRRNAVGLILAHNHPSGDPDPSVDDVAVTRSIVESGKLLDISVLDHLVIGHQRYVSLKERGLGFS